MNTIISVIAVVILVVILRLTKKFERRILEPLFMWVALFGIVALCQPFSFWLFQQGFTILLVGTIGFNVAINLKQKTKEE